MDVDDLQRTPGHLVRRLHQISSALFADELAHIGITPVQYAALVAIAALAEADATTVAKLIAYDRATIGGVIDRLEAKGLVGRRPSSGDRRVKILKATDAGRACIEAMAAGVARVQDRLLSPLSLADRASFLPMLTRLIAGHRDGGCP